MHKDEEDMMNQNRPGKEAPGEEEGARRATEASAGDRAVCASYKSGPRWSSSRKRDVVLRILRGESLDSLSRELAVEIYRLEEWRDSALSSMDAGLKTRKCDPVKAELDAALKRIGELTMENELLYERCRKGNGPFPKGRSRG